MFAADSSILRNSLGFLYAEEGVQVLKKNNAVVAVVVNGIKLVFAFFLVVVDTTVQCLKRCQRRRPLSLYPFIVVLELPLIKIQSDAHIK